MARLSGHVGVIQIVKGGSEFFRAKCGTIFDDGIVFAGSGETVYFLDNVPVIRVVGKTR